MAGASTRSNTCITPLSCHRDDPVPHRQLLRRRLSRHRDQQRLPHHAEGHGKPWMDAAGHRLAVREFRQQSDPDQGQLFAHNPDQPVGATPIQRPDRSVLVERAIRVAEPKRDGPVRGFQRSSRLAQLDGSRNARPIVRREIYAARRFLIAKGEEVGMLSRRGFLRGVSSGVVATGAALASSTPLAARARGQVIAPTLTSADLRPAGALDEAYWWKVRRPVQHSRRHDLHEQRHRRPGRRASLSRRTRSSSARSPRTRPTTTGARKSMWSARMAAKFVNAAPPTRLR